MPSKWKTSPRKKLKNKISEKNIQNSKMPWLTMVEQRKREQVRERVRKSRAQAKKRAREEQIEKTNEEKKKSGYFAKMKVKNKSSDSNIQNSKMPWLTMVEQRKREQVRERMRRSRAQAKKRAREEQI